MNPNIIEETTDEERVWLLDNKAHAPFPSQLRLALPNSPHSTSSDSIFLLPHDVIKLILGMMSVVTIGRTSLANRAMQNLAYKLPLFVHQANHYHGMYTIKQRQLALESKRAKALKVVKLCGPNIFKSANAAFLCLPQFSRYIQQ